MNYLKKKFRWDSNQQSPGFNANALSFELIRKLQNTI